nr:beta-lactamase family protein [Chloroflexota bacterium]
IAKFFPDAPEDKQQITISHVLRHRAGFPDTFGSDYQLIDRESLRRTLFETPLLAPVGQESRYSNSGYSLLAMIIEDVGGSPYEEWVHEEIIRPAGVEDFGYGIPYWPRDTLAVGIRRNGERFGTPLEHAWYGDGPGWNLRGNGGMLSNARGIHDLFLAMEQEDEVLGREARLAWRPAVQPGNASEYAALGGNGIFNAVYFRSVTVSKEGERREITWVGLSNIGDQVIEDSLEYVAETLGLR